MKYWFYYVLKCVNEISWWCIDVAWLQSAIPWVKSFVFHFVRSLRRLKISCLFTLILDHFLYYYNILIAIRKRLLNGQMKFLGQSKINLLSILDLTNSVRNIGNSSSKSDFSLCMFEKEVWRLFSKLWDYILKCKEN